MSVYNIEIKGRSFTVLKKPTREGLKVLIQNQTLPDFVEDNEGRLRYYEAEQDWINLHGFVDLDLGGNN